MNKAYIIIAHKNPEQLYRLTKKLDDGYSTFFIHIDKRINIEQFDILKKLGNSVQFVERVISKWSTFGLVQCTLNGMQAVKDSNLNFERVILLSGQDYPIKSNRYIDNYFSESPYSVFFEYWPIPDFKRWPKNNGGMYRVNKYFFGLKIYQLLLSKTINFLGNLFPFLKRKIPFQMKPFAGSQWWIMDMYALNYVLEYIRNHPVYVTFHKNTFGSDELFFQMILLNSKDARILNSIENDSKRMIKWESSETSHPEILVEADINDIKISDALFARKFDSAHNSKILDLIDEICV